MAQNSTTLIVGRAVTGLGVAGTFAGSYIIIGISASPEQRPAMTGFMGSAYAIASVIGPCELLNSWFNFDCLQYDGQILT